MNKVKADSSKAVKQILIIDDDTDFAESISDILEMYEYSPRIATNLENADTLFHECIPDVVLLDIHIGNKNGISFIEKNIHQYPDTLFLVVTAFAGVESALDALKSGAYDYLRKPISTDDLLASLDRCFEKLLLEKKNRQSEQALIRQNERLEEVNRRLRNIVESASIINSENSIKESIHAILSEFHANFTIDRSAILFNQQKGYTIYTYSGSDYNWVDLDNLDQFPILNHAIREDYRILSESERLSYEPFHDFSGPVLLLPLKEKEETQLGMVLLHRASQRFTQIDIDIARVMCSLAASAILNSRSQEELNRKETVIQQSKKMEAMGRLSSGIAHDFNNILTGILGCTELLIMNAKEADKQYLHEISCAVSHGSALTKQLLTFSRQKDTEPEIINVNTIISAMENILTMLFGDEVNLHLDLCSSGTEVEIETNQLKRVILNIAINAKDAMAGHGEFYLTTRLKQISSENSNEFPDLQTGKYVQILFRDSGPGIDKSVLPEIFEPFFTTKENERGTGLGLSTVFGIIKRSGGTITAENAPDLGAQFSILIPKALKAPNNLAISEIKEKPDYTGVHALVVEDDPAIRNIIIKITNLHGITTQAAQNGIEARDIILANPKSFDIIITDVRMPKINGYELAESVFRINTEIKILFISGNSFYHPPALVSENKNNTALLQKPFTQDELFMKISDLLS
ncbi:MAG: response regulator [Spirochaetia bacterium]